MRNWLLPEYVEDILPEEAMHIETMRRRIIDFLLVHGYQLVNPPLLEYVESLLSGSGSDMELHMFKVIDQLSGRMMGLRADMTPQVARIDAHLLNCTGVTRLCYVSSVLHTVPSGLTRTREPLQVGAELYGHAGLESDIEIQRLMLECLSILGIDQIYLDLGHVTIFRELIKNVDIPPELETELYSIFQAKDIAALKSLCSDLSKHLSEHTKQALMLLPELYGDKKVLALAYRFLPDQPEIRKALQKLEIVEKELKTVVDNIAFDLADLRGFHYHSGMVFAAYAKGCSNAIALGGRYDEIGKSFGRARPATGFSTDLRELARLIKPEPCPKGIWAPFEKYNKMLEDRIKKLRKAGEIVIVELPGQQGDKLESNCDRQLVLQDGDWIIREI